jgi:hypothetical protein
MDEFDMFNTNTQEVQAPVPQNTNIQEDYLFGGGMTDDIISSVPTNTITNDEQEDSSWVLDNVRKITCRDKQIFFELVI